MNIKNARVGDKVLYIPPVKEGFVQIGRITKIDWPFVMVRLRGDDFDSAIHPDNLTFYYD
jgi:hypothetical protein